MLSYGGLFCMFWVVLFYICSTYVASQSSSTNFHSSLDHDGNISNSKKNRDSIICMDIGPQRSLDMNKVMGTWYGNEIIIHTQDIPGVFHYKNCVRIQISDVTEQRQNPYYNTDYRRNYDIPISQPSDKSSNPYELHYDQPYHNSQQHHEMENRMSERYLRLLWTEGDDTLQYIFSYSADSLGRWTNVEEQRGSFVNLSHYTQFNGTVQVLKVVNDQLVLTFCGNDLKSTIYTIVLSRNELGLSTQDLHSIRGLLVARHLSVDTIRKTCYSTAASIKTMWTVPMFLICYAVFFFKKH